MELSCRLKTRLQHFPKLPLWIIEYVWAHKMMDIPEVVDPYDWPEVDSQPLSLEDSWRLRVSSAQTYSIMKNRDVEHFERVVGFLEDTCLILPKLVPPIKHMKIVFGLKTMVLMWMLKEGRGLVDIVFKINHFFPSKLPQYQHHCSHHDMFLMRKTHLDFKALAQELAMDKDKREDYIKYQMEEQYGEHYAQKVEDRLLQYLHKLETVLPGDTYIDKIMKKESPVTEEEKLLLEVITCDSSTIATTLKNLLHCDVASCCQSSDPGTSGMGSSRPSKTVLYGGTSRAQPKSAEAEEADRDLPKNSSDLLEDEERSDVRRRQQAGQDRQAVETEAQKEDAGEIARGSSGRVRVSGSFPRFCSKHRRWVKNILLECPDERPQESPLLQARSPTSPLLFLSSSSSSTSSSQDRTPSDLIPTPPDKQHPSPSPSTRPQIAARASDQANPHSPRSETEALCLPALSRDTRLPATLSPVVRLLDISSVKGIYSALQPYQASPKDLPMSDKKQTVSSSSPMILVSSNSHTAGNHAEPQGTAKHSAARQQDTVAPTNPPNTVYKLQTASVFQDASTSTSACRQQPIRQCFSRLSRKYGQTRANIAHSKVVDRLSPNPLAKQLKKTPDTIGSSCPTLLDEPNLSGPPSQDSSSKSTSQSGSSSSDLPAFQISLSTESPGQDVPRSSVTPLNLQQSLSPFQSTTPPRSTQNSVSSDTSGVPRAAQLRLSLPSLAVLLQSKLLQPCVSLTRVSPQECCRVTGGRSSPRPVEPAIQGGGHRTTDEQMEEEDVDSSFDPYALYNLPSSGDSVDLPDHDPDYRPRIKKSRLL